MKKLNWNYILFLIFFSLTFLADVIVFVKAVFLIIAAFFLNKLILKDIK